MNKLEIENGKYQIENNNGIVKVYRHGELWLDGVTKFELCLIQRIEELEQQNKRYQEALELLAKQETIGKDIKTGKTAVSPSGKVALKGLGVFNNDKYIVYDVDDIIESVLYEPKEESE